MSSRVRTLTLCLLVSVAIMSVASSSNYVEAVSHSLSLGASSDSWSSYSWSGSWASHTWSGSWSSHSWAWSSHTWGSWSWHRATTAYTDYYGGGYYNGGNYYNGGYYPYQNYCNPNYPSYYCGAYYPSYQAPTVTATLTATQENYITQMVTSTASVMMPTAFTSMVMVTTIDNSTITFYGVIIAALLILLGVFVFISMFLFSKFKAPPAA